MVIVKEETETATEVKAKVEIMACRRMINIKVPVLAVMETTRNTSDAQRLASFAVIATNKDT